MSDDPSQVASPQSAGVPEYGGFKVSPDGQAGFPIQVPDTREFGQAAQFLGQQSQEVAQSASRMQDVAIRAQQQADQFQSFDAVNKLDRAALDLQTGKDGFQNVHGGDVMKTGPNGEPLSVDYSNRLQQAMQSIANNLTNDSQRAQFMAMSKRTVLMFNMSAAEHQQREWNTYQESTYTGTQLQAQELARENPTNPLTTQHALDITAASIRGLGQLKGLAPALVEASVQQGQSSLIRSLIESSIEGNNFTAARDLYNTYGPEGRNFLLAEDNLAVHSAVDKETQAVDRNNIADSTLSYFAPGAPGATASGAHISGVDPGKPFVQNIPAIMRAEGTTAKGFDTILGDGANGKNALGVSTPKPLTQMSMGDVYSFQRNTLLPASGHLNSTAAGALQITSQNLAQYGPKLFGANWKSQPFDQAHQIAIAQAIHADQGYGAWSGLKTSASGSANTFSGNAPAPPPDVLTYVNHGLSQYDQLHPGATAEQRLAMEDRLKTDYNMLTESYRQQGDSALLNAQRWVVANPGVSLDRMPANLRANLPANHVEAINSLANALDPSKDRQDNPAIVNGILSGEVDLSHLTDTQMMSLRGQLTPATFQKFLAQRASIIKKQTTDAQTLDVKTFSSLVNSRLVELGLPTSVTAKTDPEVAQHVAAIRNTLHDELLSAQQAVNKRMTPEQMEGAIDHFFVKTVPSTSGWFSSSQPISMLGVDYDHMGSGDIAVATQRLAARGIKSPTHAQIEQEFYTYNSRH